MKYFISIQYDRRFYQIRFSSRCMRFIKKTLNLEDLKHMEIGLDRSQKVLVFKPLSEETDDSYHFVNKSCISSVDLARVIQQIANHNGLYRYPVQWHKTLGLAVVDLKKGQPQ